MSLASAEKDSKNYFAWVCELQTLKPEHGYKIKTDRFLASKLTDKWANYDFSDGQEEIENHTLDSMKIDAFKFDMLFSTDIFYMAFRKFRCANTFLNAWDYIDLGSFYRFQIKLILKRYPSICYVCLFSK